MSEKLVIFACDGRIHHEIPRYDTSHGTVTNIRLPQRFDYQGFKKNQHL